MLRTIFIHVTKANPVTNTFIPFSLPQQFIYNHLERNQILMQQISFFTISLIQSIFDSENKAWIKFQETNKYNGLSVDELKSIYTKHLYRKLILTLDELSKEFGTTFTIKDNTFPLQYICNTILADLSITAPESTIARFGYKIISAINSIATKTVTDLKNEPFIYSVSEKQWLRCELSKLLDSAIYEAKAQFNQKNIHIKQSKQKEIFNSKFQKQIKNIVTDINKEFDSNLPTYSNVFEPTTFATTLLLIRAIDTNNISLIQTLSLRIVDSLYDVSNSLIA